MHIYIDIDVYTYTYIYIYTSVCIYIYYTYIYIRKIHLDGYREGGQLHIQCLGENKLKR